MGRHKKVNHPTFRSAMLRADHLDRITYWGRVTDRTFSDLMRLAMDWVLAQSPAAELTRNQAAYEMLRRRLADNPALVAAALRAWKTGKIELTVRRAVLILYRPSIRQIAALLHDLAVPLPVGKRKPLPDPIPAGQNVEPCEGGGGDKQDDPVPESAGPS